MRGLVLRCQRANLRHFPGFAFLSCVVASGALADFPAQETPAYTRRQRRQDPCREDAGRQIFESRCASCHGLDGLGGEHAPAIATRDAVGHTRSITRLLKSFAMASKLKGCRPSRR